MTLTEELRFDTTPPQSTRASDDPALFGFLSPDEIDPTFHLVLTSILALPAGSAVATIGRFQNILTATEAGIIAQSQASGASPGQTDELINQGGKRSKREKKKRANRGTTLNNNPDLKDDVAEGTVSEEQLDDLADADSKTGGAASQDPELLNEVRNSNPDQSKDAIKSFVNDHNRPDTETEHERQRRVRKISKFTTKDGIPAIMAEGDQATIDSVWEFIRKKANQMYRKDGGRDVPASQHPRSHAQRWFDAFADFFDGESGGSSGSRPTIVIGAELDDESMPINPVQFGSGPIPQNVFERYLCNATVTGILFSGSGQPLWHGHKHRMATPVQFTALVARDRGCVLCRAPHSECEAHHLMPWAAPGKGRTDITNLALVCRSCHHQLHDNKRTLFQDAERRWKTRRATESEIAPPKPAKAPTGSSHRSRRQGRASPP